MKIRVASDLQPDSIVDGEGIRTVLWTQGCSHHCLGCHNQGTWDFDGGVLVDVELVKEEIAKLKGQDGITLSGGDPFFQVEPCLEIAKYCKSIGLNVWCYTGFTFEELMKLPNPNIKELLKNIDILVDGRFILREKSLDLLFKGSRNQRIIDAKASIKMGKPVLIEKYSNDQKIENMKKRTNIYI